MTAAELNKMKKADLVKLALEQCDDIAKLEKKIEASKKPRRPRVTSSAKKIKELENTILQLKRGKAEVVAKQNFLQQEYTLIKSVLEETQQPIRKLMNGYIANGDISVFANDVVNPNWYEFKDKKLQKRALLDLGREAVSLLHRLPESV